MRVARADFAWGEFAWTARLELRGVVASGPVEVVVAPEGRGSEPLSDAELAQVQWLVDNCPGVFDVVLAAVVEEYPALQEQCGYLPEERASYMPDVRAIEDLAALIELSAVHVHSLFAGGVPYLGFEFECRWDPEHGLGVLTHGTRVVEVGGADTAFLLWIAERDAGANRLDHH